ncbi:hypothetical protein [Curtobacterium sp. ER1/6]|uniref:hypothetical protein n=1 Tax=Curtobacterium sp. ER1/6 TaxID=1891920 RepID=UPI00084FA013|nr:hypothetical protein [Curtobacterium sp. ER1/6]
MQRTTTITRATLAGVAVGTAAAVLLWSLVAVVTTTSDQGTAAGFAAASLAVTPALVLGGAVLGLAVGLALALVAPALRRGGAPRAAAIVVVGLLAFVVWGTATVQLVSKEVVVVGAGVSTDAVQLVAAVFGAVAGAGVTVVTARGRFPLPAARVGRTVLLWTVVGALAGVSAWAARRSGVPLLSGLPAETAFVGSGFGDSDVPITLEWVWAVLTGAFAGAVVGVVRVLTARRWAAVVAAALAAAVAAFVAARTGLLFPSLGERPFDLTYPFVDGWATPVVRQPLGAVLATVTLCAAAAAVVAGALTLTAARLCDRRRRASRPI